MDDVKNMILADALETAIKSERNNIKLKRIIIAQAVIIIILSLVILL